MARRRRRHKDAILDGLIGAGIGAMNFKLNEAAQRRLEEAEMAKEQRLAAIRAGEVERAAQIQTARDTANYQNQIALADKNIAAQTELEAGRQRHAKELVEIQGSQRMREIGAQGANSLAAAQASRGPGDTRLFQDQDGRQYEIGAGDSARLEKLQSEGKKLQLIEGTRGGRYSAIPGTDNGGGPLMGGGPALGNGAASPAAAPPSFVWDQKTQRLVPAR